MVDLPERYTAPDVGEPSSATLLTYNLDRQVTLLTRPDGQAITYAYDPTEGRLNTATTPRGITSYAYEPGTGNLASVSDPGRLIRPGPRSAPA